MKIQDLIEGVHLLDLFLQLIEIWLENLDHNVVDKVLAEMEHTVSEVVTLLVKIINAELFRGLVEHPSVSEMTFDTFTEE